jgi:peptidoglycan hydrolase CwlO-like protein
MTVVTLTSRLRFSHVIRKIYRHQITNILKFANDISNLQSQYSNLKKEVDKLQQQIIDYNLRVGPKVSAP